MGAQLSQKTQSFKALSCLHLGIITRHLLAVEEKYLNNYIYMYLHLLANVHTPIEVISYYNLGFLISAPLRGF